MRSANPSDSIGLWQFEVVDVAELDRDRVVSSGNTCALISGLTETDFQVVGVEGVAAYGKFHCRNRGKIRC